MFDKLLEESVSEAEALTHAIDRETGPVASRTSPGTAVTRALRSLPVDVMLAAIVIGWEVPQKSISWWM
jgi:hypothetical protein